MFAEAMYQGLKKGDDKLPESVHLVAYPEAHEIDKEILAAMKDTRAIVSFGLESRARAGIKVRQPLRALKAVVKHEISDEMKELVKDEVNVKEVQIEVDKGAKTVFVELDTEMTKELREEGLARETVRTIQEMRKKAGFEVADRIEIYYETTAEPVREVLAGEWQEYIARETLAVKLEAEKVKELDYNEDALIEKQPIWIGLKKKK